MSRSNQEFVQELNQAIDFDKVLHQIASFASFSCAKENILQAIPHFDKNEMQEELNYVQEAIEIVRLETNISFAGCSDISMEVKKAQKQMTLTSQELFSIYLFLTSVRNVKQSMEECEAFLLQDLCDSMEICHDLMKQISSMIDMSGSIKNDATETLRRKNKQLIDTRLSLQERARHFLKRNSSYLMENMTTSIGGRLSVLVKVQDKNKFGGMIHGQSQSGLAAYVEPSEFVEMNNQLLSIESDIEEEKKRICRELTKKVDGKALFILSALETMTILDVAFTKAKWAYRYDGCIPIIHANSHSLRLEYARHPLIDEKKVVANTYVLKSNENCLMISGPNMGGKTVTLKTIGLFIALSHAGFPVLCHHATIPYFRSIWFDIGDNQSIENNLSTFSSHISRLSRICEECDSHSFVLLDEIGNGTDPLEGSSLAIAILEYLINRKCTVVTSTHYSQVKSYGKTNSHVLVSSVEFDGTTLMPTYRYIPGISGASYAFSIAKQYKLADSILERADFYKAQNEENIERELEKLERLQNLALIDKDRFTKLIEDAHRIQKEAREEKRKWEAKNKELNEAFESRLQEMLDEKEQEANDIIKELRSMKSNKQHKQSDLLHEMHLLQQEAMPEEQEKEEVFKIGDYVQLDDLNTHGEIIDIRKKEATILTNGIKMKVKMNRLHKIHKPMVTKPQRKAHVDKAFKRFPLEINLIGMRVEEGIRALDDYIDQAVYHNVKQVRVIHGMGTGALRNAVWKDLDKHPMVNSKTSAGPNEGGLGATIVTLK